LLLKADQLALWLNASNAFDVKSILDGEIPARGRAVLKRLGAALSPDPIGVDPAGPSG